MMSKFPVWITIVLALQMLVALAVSAFLLILGSAYGGGGSLNLGSITGLVALILPPPLCFWLARQQWQGGRYGVAKLLAFAPILLFCVLAVFLEVVMA
jgi:hypothetical protein